MVPKINTLCVTGASGSGNSTFGRLLKSALAPESEARVVFHADMEDIVNWGLQEHTPLGNDLRACRSLLQSGDNLPDRLVKPLLHSWFERRMPRETILLIFSGYPSNEQEIRILKQSDRISLFGLIHISVSKDQARINTHRHARDYRSESKAGRVEDVFTRKWQRHATETLPAVQNLNGAVFELDFNTPLIEKLDAVIRRFRHDPPPGCPVSKNMANRGLHRLHHRPHPELHTMIREIESPTSVTKGRSMITA